MLNTLSPLETLKVVKAACFTTWSDHKTVSQSHTVVERGNFGGQIWRWRDFLFWQPSWIQDGEQNRKSPHLHFCPSNPLFTTWVKLQFQLSRVMMKLSVQPISISHFLNFMVFSVGLFWLLCLKNIPTFFCFLTWKQSWFLRWYLQFLFVKFNTFLCCRYCSFASTFILCTRFGYVSKHTWALLEMTCICLYYSVIYLYFTFEPFITWAENLISFVLLENVSPGRISLYSYCFP